MRLIRRRHRHEHDWEVVEKTLVEGMPLEDAVEAAKAASGYVPFEKITDAAQAHMIVHYRCLCGAEKVERV
jgi:hypothetical protein